MCCSAHWLSSAVMCAHVLDICTGGWTGVSYSAVCMLVTATDHRKITTCLTASGCASAAAAPSLGCPPDCSDPGAA